MTNSLAGVKVLDLTRLQPGNYATWLLAGLGADVIKVEEPGRGDYVRWIPPMTGQYSAAHEVMNAGKRSVTLNLKVPEAKEVFLTLVERCDVLIEAFRPAVMDRLGLSFDRLISRNPRLVYAAITGFGQTGPYRNRAGHDINYIGMSGLLESTGSRDGPPVLPSAQIADLSGALIAVSGILAALFQRSSTGKGAFVDASMLDGAVSLMALHLSSWFAGGGPLGRGGGLLNGGYAFYRVYRCLDGKYVTVGAIEPEFWKNLCKVCGLEDLAGDQFAAEPRSFEVHSAFESTFASRTREQWLEAFEGVDACVGPVNDFEEMSADPQVRARGTLRDGASIRHLVPPLGEVPARPAPALGEHNEEVFGEMGLDGGQIAALRETGAI